ncbi:MAG: DUF302 domain-containing protein [Gemmatimonadota bacterium]
MSTPADYALARTVDLSFAEADARIRDALQAEGFGILTEIDVSATLKEKLDVDFPPYEILGACNPPLAHQALQLEADVGLLLPCNVVVRSLEDGRTMVEALGGTGPHEARDRGRGVSGPATTACPAGESGPAGKDEGAAGRTRRRHEGLSRS